MAQVQRNGLLTFNGVNYTPHGVGITTDKTDVEPQDATTWETGAVVYEPSLPDGEFSVVMRFDPTADATLDAAAKAGTKGALAWRYSSAAISATNPEYQVTAFISSYQRGSMVGKVQDVTVSFKFNSAVVRDTTP